MTDIFGPHTADMGYKEREVMNALVRQNKVVYPVVYDDCGIGLREQGPLNISSSYNNRKNLELFSDGYIIPVDMVDLNGSGAHMPGNGWQNKFYGNPDFIFFQPDEGFYFIDLKGFKDYFDTNKLNLAQISPYNGKRLICQSEYLKRVIQEYTTADEPVTFHSGCYIINKGTSFPKNGLYDYIQKNFRELIEEKGAVSLKSKGFIPSLEISSDNLFSSDMEFSAQCFNENYIKSMVRHLKKRIRGHGFYPVDFCVLTGFDLNFQPITELVYSPSGFFHSDSVEIIQLEDMLTRYEWQGMDLFSKSNFKRQYDLIVHTLKHSHLSELEKKLSETDRQIESIKQSYHEFIEQGAQIDAVSKWKMNKHEKLREKILSTGSKLQQAMKKHGDLMREYKDARDKLKSAIERIYHNDVYEAIEKKRQEQIAYLRGMISDLKNNKKQMDGQKKSTEKKEQWKMEKERKVLENNRDPVFQNISYEFAKSKIKLSGDKREVNFCDNTPFQLPRELYIKLNGDKAYKVLLFETIQI